MKAYQEQLKTASERSFNLPRIDVELLGRKLTCVTTKSAVEAISNACINSSKILVSHYNVHSFNLSMQIPWLFEFQRNADMVLCDSMGILYALRFAGLDLPTDYRVSYTLLVPKLLEMCNKNHFSIFLLGGSEKTLPLALARMKAKYPNIQFDGHHGYSENSDEVSNTAIIQKINLFKPHILIIGMGVPKQEEWLSLYHHRVNANVSMNGGAVIDRMAGIVKDCPIWISNRGFEWLYRLLNEPKRLFSRYILGNLAFVFQLLLAKSNANPEACLKILSASDLSIVQRQGAYEQPISVA